MTSSCLYLGFALGPPKGAVARFLGLGEASWAWEWHFLGLVWVNLGASQLGWVYLGLSIKIPDGPIYGGKTSIFGVETSIIIGFLDFSWISKDMPWKF